MDPVALMAIHTPAQAASILLFVFIGLYPLPILVGGGGGDFDVTDRLGTGLYSSGWAFHIQWNAS